MSDNTKPPRGPDDPTSDALESLLAVAVLTGAFRCPYCGDPGPHGPVHGSEPAFLCTACGERLDRAAIKTGVAEKLADDPTMTALPVANDVDTEPPPPPPSSVPIIARGTAQQRMSAALTALVDAYMLVEKLSMGLAAGIDATVPETTP